MNSLVQYCDSDEEQDDRLDPSARSLSPSPVPSPQKNSKRSSVKVSVGLASLPAPKGTKRRQLSTVLDAEDDRSPPTSANGDSTAKSSGNEVNRNGDSSSEYKSDHIPVAPKLLIDDVVQGPAAAPSFDPSSNLPHIMFRGRIVPPPPGLLPPPGLKLHGDLDVLNSHADGDLPNDHSFVNGLRKGNIMELNQDDLRRFELSRPVDPLGATRGELIQSEIAAGQWTSKQGQLLSTATATFNQSRRHHINSMATTASLMEESIRQKASVGQDRRRMAKAKYGW